MEDSIERKAAAAEPGVGAISRVFAVVRALGEGDPEGEKVTRLAERVGLSQPTTHRLLRGLVEEGMVEQCARSKRYRLSLDFFALAARAGQVGNLRDLARTVCHRPAAPFDEASQGGRSLLQRSFSSIW